MSYPISFASLQTCNYFGKKRGFSFLSKFLASYKPPETMEGPSVNPSLSTRPGTGQWSFPRKLGSYSTSYFTNKKIEIQSYQEAHPNGQLEEGGRHTYGGS